jgi:hypothetical protein
MIDSLPGMPAHASRARRSPRIITPIRASSSSSGGIGRRSLAEGQRMPSGAAAALSRTERLAGAAGGLAQVTAVERVAAQVGDELPRDVPAVIIARGRHCQTPTIAGGRGRLPDLRAAQVELH